MSRLCSPLEKRHPEENGRLSEGPDYCSPRGWMMKVLNKIKGEFLRKNVSLILKFFKRKHTKKVCSETDGRS